MNKQWERVQSLFAQAADLRPEERVRFLDMACAGDDETRREVESLLAHGDVAEHHIAEALVGTAQSLVESATIKSGTRIGDYQVQGLIGSGGMGEVYQARDVRLSRSVAIKVLPPFLSNDADRLRRFEQEARAAAALNHPNIVAVYQMGFYQGAPYLVSELLEGDTLRGLTKRGPLPWRAAVEYGVQIARGLAAAHGKGITHRDLKPENLFVTNDGHVKILDFGLAKLSDPLSSDHPRLVSEVGLIMGTVGYMSPEQVRGQAVDYRSDFFAFGAVLHEILSGKRAFEKPTLADTMSAILNEEAPRISELLPVPPALRRVVLRCLEKKREQRFQSASDLAFALEALSDSGRIAVAEASSAGRGKLWKVAVPLLKVAVPLSIVVLLLAGGIYYRSHRSQRLTGKDTTVIADFANSTGDPIFDDTLKAALTVSLRQSPFLNVLSDGKVAGTLRLMARPTTTPLTPDLAREVCQRAGSKAYIAGSIASLGSEYVLGLKAANCQSGDLLAQEQVTAPGKEKVLDALGDAASRLRGQLGESLATVQSFDVPLIQATTSSLDALKAFSVGRKVMREQGEAAALPYHQRAIELDPNFAMGYFALAEDYYGLSETGRVNEYMTKAFQLSEHASEWERLQITARYYESVTGQLDKAAQTYLEEIATRPLDYGAHGNLANIYVQQGQYEKAAEAYREDLSREHDSVEPYSDLANTLLALQRVDEARQIIDQAHAQKLENFGFRSTLYAVSFLNADVPGMEEQLQWFKGKPEETFGLSLESDTEAYAGRLHKARELTRQSADSATRTDNKESAAIGLENAALREAALGNSLIAKQYAADGLKLAPASPGAQAEAGLAFAMAGDAARAESLAQDLNKQFPLHTQMQSLWLPAIKGQLALRNNRPARAVAELQAALPIEFGQFTFTNNVSCLYPTYIRGQAFLALGQARAAAGEFQKILDHGGIVWNCWTGALAHLGVARANALQAKTSQGADADPARALAAYKGFLTLWKDADTDIPILKEAKAECAKLQ